MDMKQGILAKTGLAEVIHYCFQSLLKAFQLDLAGGSNDLQD